MRTLHEFGRALKLAIESGKASGIPAVSNATATPAEAYRVQADTIRRWVRGENDPGALELGRVALVVGVSLDSLVYDTEPRPAVLAPPSGTSFSEKQLAELLEGVRALDRLNRLIGHRIDVVATYCAAPKGTLAAIEARASKKRKKGG